jgi:hypothetical protein
VYSGESRVSGTDRQTDRQTDKQTNKMICKGTVATTQIKSTDRLDRQIRLNKQKELCIMSRALALRPRKEGKSRRVSITTIQS